MVSSAWPGVTVAVDASTYLGTVAVLRDGVIVARGSAQMRGEHDEALMPAILAALDGVGCALPTVAHVICGAGPGSFTSLRIAGAIAKGICMGTGASLSSVSSLALIVAGGEPAMVRGRWLALLDAMRDERYAALVEARPDGTVCELEVLGRISVTEIPSMAERLGAQPVGPREPFEVWPHVQGVERLLETIARDGPVSIDSWEPDYGRLAEAQVKWEAAHRRPLGA